MAFHDAANRSVGESPRTDPSPTGGSTIHDIAHASTAHALLASRPRLQHAYDRHRGDFGFDRNQCNETLGAFAAELARLMNDAGTLVRHGRYRRRHAVDHFLHAPSGRWIARDAVSGDLVAAFRLSPIQVENLLAHGHVR